MLVQGLGMISLGRTLKAARLSRDLYHRAIAVMNGATALGRFVSLTDAESFAVEYWPLELYKLSLAPPPRAIYTFAVSRCSSCGGVLLWADGRLVCVKSSCPQWGQPA